MYYKHLCYIFITHPFVYIYIYICNGKNQTQTNIIANKYLDVINTDNTISANLY